ncbi:Zona pellucida sperm-binding protein 4 [Anabarilius grahami]|uniref:Zona pellucida sperm-binding protein 4 n=1 Tax=Anabarilius grahami TaxID=495550 RepID=A0A3N0YWT2_ANAGA|nr:Zona pellucida sperm-binding protein 4 [Anabarilius grahami]
MDGLLRNCATGCRVDEAFTMDDLVDSISADTSGLRCGHVQAALWSCPVEDRIHHAGMDGLLRNCATGCRVDEAFTMDDLVDSISADTSGLRCGHVQLRIVFITPAYTSYYSGADYPVTKVLREPVYVEVRILERTDPNIVLMLGHCWATSSPLSLPQWDLLVDGCPYQDDRYLTTLVPMAGSSGLQFPTHYKRFVVKMFTFVDPASLAPLQETWSNLPQNPQALMFQQTDQRFQQPAQQQASPQFQQQVQQASQQFSQQFQPKQPVAQAEPLDKCAVADYEQIQCGPPGISGAECEAINCCFNGQQCYYGKAVTVQCIRDGQFVVVVARDVTLPRLSLDSVRLLGGSDPPCSPVGSTPSFAIYQFPVTACGTSMMEDSGYVVYENRMTSSYEVGIGPLGSITRDSHFELLFQCWYSGTSVEALVVEVNTVPPPPPVAAPGPLRVELRLANGQCVTKGCAEGDEAYTSYYTDADYPVTKVLREPVYVEVRILERTDPNIVLMLGHCWATSTPSPLSLPQWDLLVDGCPYQDDRYLTTLVPVAGSSGLQFPTHYKRFVVKMFTFVDPSSLAPLQETWSNLPQNPQALMFQQTDQRFQKPAQQQASQQFQHAVQQASQQFSQQFQPKQPVAQAEPLDKCAVADYEQIQCGPPGISGAECEAINCCFNGQQCYYGKAVTVQCIRDGQFVVVVARDVTLPRLSLDSVRLLGGNDPPCSPVGSTPTFAIYQFPVTACGTSMMEDSGYVVYENRMTSSYEVGIGPLGSITRDSHFELLFQCRYSGSSVEALVVEVNTVPPPPPVAAPGPLRVELRLANGQCVTKGCAEGDEAYTSYYTDADYPVTKVLREPVYIEVRILERTDPNIVLMLGHCWATSTPSPLSLPQWDLLVDGCPYQDDRYLTTLVPVAGSSGLQFPTHYKRFVVKMFTFVDPASLAPLQETVFIHCSTEVCHPSSGSCQQSCSRQRRDVQMRTTTTGQSVVSSGEVRLIL